MATAEPGATAGAAGSVYYVMLAFGESPPADFVRLTTALAARLGGRPDELPHVTLTYLRGDAPAEAVAACLREVRGPAVALRARGVFSFLETAHPTLGHTVSLHVERDAALRRWHEAVCAAVAPLGLAPLRAWEAQHHHIRLLNHLPAHIGVLRGRLDGDEPALTVQPTELLVTVRVGEGFELCVRRPLGPAPAARE